ncbi:unnamed protein product [Periconia digitata]|uniref:Aurora kinase n=1 Tax=Periconia digitata TaxID=1303443 RepID=A0A9W4ULV0_9PLEO|nr:unnamed protein product [Periconia digitata]
MYTSSSSYNTPTILHLPRLKNRSIELFSIRHNSTEMAPTKKPVTRNQSRKDNDASNTESFLGAVKSSIVKTKARFTALRTIRRSKTSKSEVQTITHPKSREHLKDIVEGRNTIKDVVVEEHHKDKTVDDPSRNQGDDEGTTVRRPPKPLTIENFELSRRLGRGKFGRVHLARHLETNYICAVKVLSKQQITSETSERLVRRELEVHQNLAHPHILRFYTWMDDPANIYLVLEYAPNGNLFDLMMKQPKKRFMEPEAAAYISQMAQALRYLHSKNIMHRDIKPENILLGLHNEMKLADFGYSVHSNSGLRSTLCGTLDYLPPEMAIGMLKPEQEKKWYTKAVDQWSLGVLTYELLVGRAPFEMKCQEETQKRIAHFKGRLRFPQHVSLPAEDFMRQLLNLDAEQRMGLDDVLYHSWIKNNVDHSSRTGIRSLNRKVNGVMDDA